MNLKITSVVIVLVAVLLLAQSITVVEAKHKAKDNGEIRKDAEKKSIPYNEAAQAVIDEKRKAFVAYKVAFDAWKIAKEDYKDAKTSGVQTTIDEKKVLLDVAKITKDKAWKTYQESKKLKTR